MASRQAGPVSSQSQVNVSTAKASILQTQAEQRSRLLDEYFESTKLLQVVQDFMTNLAGSYKTQFRLPANPYPELLKTIRMHELRQAIALDSNKSSSTPLTLTVLNGQSSMPSQFQVCSVEHEQFALPIWGLKSTMEQLTGANLYSLLELINSAFRSLVIYKNFTDDDCHVVAYGALVGNCFLGARVQDLQSCFLDLETHVFVSGAHLEKTMAVFARFLAKQLHETVNAVSSFSSLGPEEAAEYRGCVACDGITITPLEEEGEPTVWNIDRVKESRISFTNAVKTALVTNSLITLDRYDAVKSSGSNRIFLCRTEQVFFFHFTAEKMGKPVKNVTANLRRSFLVGSRALAAGIYFDLQGALEVTARFRMQAQITLEEERKKQPQKRQAGISTTQSFAEISNIRSRSGFVGVLQDTVDELRRIGLSNEILRQQLDSLVSCFAFNLGYLVEAYQVLESILCRTKWFGGTVAMIQASFTSLGARMKTLLEEWETSAPTSTLQPICFIIRHFSCLMKRVSLFEDDRQIHEFVEALRCVNELLLIVVRIAFSDFIRLARTTVPPLVAPATAKAAINVEPGSLATVDEIDVPRALEITIEERKYPSSIVSEAIFAQAIIDSCLDVALESAVMNTVAFRLPPNPFTDMSSNLQVFALRQLVWKHKEQTVISKNITKVAECGSLGLFSMGGVNACALNPKLLQLVDSDKIRRAQRWLLDYHVLHEGIYKPSKSSYSVAIIPVVLVFHPILFAASPNYTEEFASVKEIDAIEQYVVEGKEIAQARLFFMEAVRLDLRRIASYCCSNGRNSWQLQARARVLDPRGQIVSELHLSPSTMEDALAGSIKEATRTQFLVQVAIEVAELKTQGDYSSMVVHKVTKAYAFHHHSTGDHDMSQSSTQLSRLMSFRVCEYGVFFSKENALLSLDHMELDASHAQGSRIPRNTWTPYASEAYNYDDSFLICQLGVVHTPNSGSPQQDFDNEHTNRLIGHSDICQLYSLEQSVRWLLDALQQKLQQLMQPRSRKDDILSGLSPATVFNIHQRLVLQIIAQVERLIVPLNYQLHFLHNLSEPLATLQKRVARWQTIQHPTEEQLDFQSKQQHKTQDLLPTPRGDPVSITNELVDSLRTTWVLVLFLRFSYQRAFFANAIDNADIQREQ
ncbi:hypothetical protein F444_17672 [Phytophthora nicotianae P1976]|uniref:Uncharacterized protein n=1 Tax=Phytophthora nicotianae P1976 TaxID=1317066 RepID=A0A080ZE51_PHYNI|nr:hypothetical protein F444_17672 [Phytophthora nicotianae P1976]